jgi:hypothetical protein
MKMQPTYGLAPTVGLVRIVVLQYSFNGAEMADAAEIQAPPVYAAALANILKCGYCLPVDPDDINPFRIDDGLDPLILAPKAIIEMLLSR